MEAMKQWEETEEPAVMALRGRLPRQQSNTDTTTMITGSGAFVFSSESSASSSEAEAEAEYLKGEESKGTPRNGNFVSGKNGGTEFPYGISGLNVENVDFLTSKKNPDDEIMDVKEENLSFQKTAENVDFLTSKKYPDDETVDAKVENLSFQKTAVTAHQDEGEIKGGTDVLPGFGSSPSKQSIEQNGHSTADNIGTTERGRINLREISAQEVSEVYLERVYEKPASHEFYCPNCKNCITKVIIRSTPPPPPPIDPIRCTSCFSFLIPAGSWFFPKLVPKDEEDDTEQGTNIEDVEVGVLVSSYNLDGTLPDQHNQTALSKGPVPNESIAATKKPTIPAQSAGVEFPVPSHDSSETYGQKPTVPAQSVGVSQAASIDKAPVPGELVEASVGDTETAKPFGNNYESSVGVQVSVSSHESNGTLHNENLPLPGQSVGISVLVTSKPLASEIDVVPTSRDPPQLQEKAVPAETELPECTTVIIPPEPPIIPVPGDTKTVEILKSIVYGGLTEAITSLGIVTSAASADTATLNILALALANLVGGLFIIGHNLWELKDDQSKVPSSQTDEQVDKYQKVLGKRENFSLHAPVAILSFIVFGLVPPLVYGFSFCQSNNRDLKITALAVASLLCIIVLAVGKAYIQRPQKYIKTILYYITFGIGVAGLSYLAGDLIDKLMEKLGWFSSNVSGTLPFPQMSIVKPALESY